MFRYDLLSDVEIPILGYGIAEKEYVSPLFAKPFGDTYFVYTEIKGAFCIKELFKDQSQAMKWAETFLTD